MRAEHSIYLEIIRNIRGRCLKNEPLSRHTSFGIGGPADFLALPADEEDLKAIIGLAAESIPWMVIGNGTNLLVADRGVRGLVVKIGPGFGGIERKGRRLIVGAGLSLPALVEKCRQWGLSGLEWAVGIPGSVGGALVMNAGAYGGEMSQAVRDVFGLGPDGRWQRLPAGQIDFGYRRARYPQGFVITGCTLALSPGDPKSIARLMGKWLEKRKFNQPLSLRSAGCIFKNPEGDSARRLIGLAGLRGYRLGGAGISSKHANFIVNYGGAKAADVLRLMELVQKRVLKECGVSLEPEVRMVGEW